MDLLQNETQIADPIFDLAVSPDYTQDKICFAARASGLYQSKDGGQTWGFALDTLKLDTHLAISCVALAPNFKEMPHVFAAGPGGILRSLDGGETWYVTMLPSPPPYITSLALSPNYSQDGIVFAGTLDDGLFRSTDQGANWTAWNFGLFDMHILSMAVSPNFTEDKNIFLGTESGIFRSVNGGLGWREVDFSVEHAPVLSLAISPNYSQDGTLFAGAETAGLFYSKDRGMTWELVAGVDKVGSVNTILLSSDFPTDPCLVIGNEEMIVVSRDRGLTWSSWRSNLQFEDQLLAIAAPKSVCQEMQFFAGLANGEILII